MEPPCLGSDGNGGRLPCFRLPAGNGDFTNQRGSVRFHGTETVVDFHYLAFDEIRLTDETGNVGVHRSSVDFLGRAHLCDFPSGKHGHPVCHRQRLLLIVSHVDAGEAVFLHDAADLAAHLHAELGVEVRERLVEQQAAGFHHQRPGEAHALLLATGHLVDGAVAVATEPHHFQSLRHPPLDLHLRDFPLLQAEGDILADGQVWPQRVALENHRRLALVRGEGGDICFPEENFPVGGRLQPRDAAQQGRLSATGTSQQEKQLARPYFKVQAVQRSHRAPEHLPHIFNPDCFHIPRTHNLANKPNIASPSAADLLFHSARIDLLPKVFSARPSPWEPGARHDKAVSEDT